MPAACRSAVFCSGSAITRPSSYLPRPYNVIFPSRNFPPLRLNILGSAAIRASAKSDHYSTLYVGRRATLQEIKPSYRNLARKYHPDMSKSPGAEEKLKEISAAYEVCRDSMEVLVRIQEWWIHLKCLMQSLANQMAYMEDIQVSKMAA